MRRRGNTKKSFALGALVGGVCGGMTALIYATTKKGRYFCNDLSKKCGKASDRVIDYYDDAREKSEEFLRKARSLVSSTKKNGRKKRK